MGFVDNNQTKQADLTFVRAAMRTPMLEREHEFELATRWREKGDVKALHELVGAYNRLVIAMAAKFKYYGLPVADLVQEGNIGLMQAAARFEPEREIRFSTYASWWVKAAMQDYILKNWSIVRTGTTAGQKSLFFNLRRLRAKLASVEGQNFLDEAGVKKIATDLGVSVREVNFMQSRLSNSDQSLNASLGTDSEEEWGTMLADNTPSPEEIVIGLKDGKTRSRWLNQALRELSPREREIISRRRLTVAGETLESIGQALGISKERVRQLESRAMDKLRETMLSHVKNPRDLIFEDGALGY